jgi:branched-chain amino acid transport system substrate-binding protein
VKNYKNLTILFILLLSMILPIEYSCTQTPAATKTIKIGFINSLTGPMSAGFKAICDAVKPTESYLNSKGGINIGNEKYLIEIISQDDQSTAGGAVAAAEALKQSGAKFIISPSSPPSLQGMTPVAEEAKIISMCPMQVDGSLFTKANKYSFNAFATAYNVSPTYTFLKNNYPNVKTIAIISPDDPGAHFVLNLVLKEIPNMGYKIVGQEQFPFDIQDFYPVVTKVLANKPDAIDCIGGIAPWAAGITKSARDFGFKGPIFCSSVIGDINQLKSMIDPKYSYDFFQGAPDVLSDKMSSTVKDFRNTIEQAKLPFSMDSVLVLSALLPLKQGIEKAQSIDSDKVVASLENLSAVDTCWGTAQWKGQELGLQHLLVVNDTPFSRITKDGSIEFVFVKH